MYSNREHQYYPSHQQGWSSVANHRSRPSSAYTSGSVSPSSWLDPSPTCRLPNCMCHNSMAGSSRAHSPQLVPLHVNLAGHNYYLNEAEEALRQQQEHRQQRQREHQAAEEHFDEAEEALRLKHEAEKRKQHQRLHDRLILLERQQQQRVRFARSAENYATTSPMASPSAYPHAFHNHVAPPPPLDLNANVHTHIGQAQQDADAHAGVGSFSRCSSAATSAAPSPTARSNEKECLNSESCNPYCRLTRKTASKHISRLSAESGATLLHAAAKCGHHLCCLAMIAKGADPRIKDKNGDSPAQVAKKGQHFFVAEVLFNKALMY